MIPIKVTFKSGQFITAWSTNPDEFAHSVADISPPEISGLDYTWADHDKTPPELQEVTINLKSGSVIMCEIPKAELEKLSHVDEIFDYQKSTTITYAKLVKDEVELDSRFSAATAVINNMPNLDVRLYMHKEYLKRKAAYVAALEAIVEGCIRRPEE